MVSARIDQVGVRAGLIPSFVCRFRLMDDVGRVSQVELLGSRSAYKAWRGFRLRALPAGEVRGTPSASQRLWDPPVGQCHEKLAQ